LIDREGGTFLPQTGSMGDLPGSIRASPRLSPMAENTLVDTSRGATSSLKTGFGGGDTELGSGEGSEGPTKFSDRGPQGGAEGYSLL
jgi:hypothetical protein